MELKSAEKLSSSSSQLRNYAIAARRDIFPARTQGLVLDVKEGLTLTDYTVAFNKIVEPVNVIYSSRISNGRICIYVRNKELVELITDKNEFIEVGANKERIAVRPLVSKQQRIIISNVAPPIPHQVLVGKFDSYGIKCSPITILRAGITESGYEYLLSSRRQTFIKKEDVSKLPEFFKIEYEDIDYYVYPATDTLKCYECNLEGHIRKHCPNLIDEPSHTAAKLDNNIKVNEPLDQQTSVHDSQIHDRNSTLDETSKSLIVQNSGIIEDKLKPTTTIDAQNLSDPSEILNEDKMSPPALNNKHPLNCSPPSTSILEKRR